MKRRVLGFLGLVLIGLVLVPLLNLAAGNEPEGRSRWRRRTLYNTDLVSAGVSRALLWLGISTDPGSVVAGRDGWLYLGDDESQTVSVARRGQTPEDVETGRRVAAAAQAWEAWLASRGVQLYRVMVGPDKMSIYPEHLPQWAKPAQPSALDGLFAGAGSANWVDLRPALLEAKSSRAEPLYYRTDSHWTKLGAGVGFRAFAQTLGSALPDVRWPLDAAVRVQRVAERRNGDLGRLLRIRWLSDDEAWTEAHVLPLDTVHRDFRTGQVMRSGGNPHIGLPPYLLHVVSEHALNARRVLWLRDSFGDAIGPLMALTFSETLQLHWQEALRDRGSCFAELVERFKPDLVFVTVVERATRSELLQVLPPEPGTPRRPFSECRSR